MHISFQDDQVVVDDPCMCGVMNIGRKRLYVDAGVLRNYSFYKPTCIGGQCMITRGVICAWYCGMSIPGEINSYHTAIPVFLVEGQV